MREAWVNVYQYRDGTQVLGFSLGSREQADLWAPRAVRAGSKARRVLVLRVRERLPTGVRKPKFEDMGQGA